MYTHVSSRSLHPSPYYDTSMLIISLTPYPTLPTAKILQSVDDDLTLIQYEFPHDDAVYRTACEKVVAAFWQGRAAGTKWTLYHRADDSDQDVDEEYPYCFRLAYDCLMADLAGETTPKSTPTNGTTTSAVTSAFRRATERPTDARTIADAPSSTRTYARLEPEPN